MTMVGLILTLTQNIPFHSNIIKSIHSCISHKNIHTIPLSNLPHYLSLWVYVPISSFPYIPCMYLPCFLFIYLCHIFALFMFLPYFFYVFIFAIFFVCFYLYHILNFIQPFPSSIGDQI